MASTKRIVLNLTTQEFEELYRAVRNHQEAGPWHQYNGQDETIAALLEKVAERYEKWGCP
jgi:hypothetical protein